MKNSVLKTVLRFYGVKSTCNLGDLEFLLISLMFLKEVFNRFDADLDMNEKMT
jgi:hypothetical protein